MLENIKSGIKEMVNIILDMWLLLHTIFMEHNLELYKSILEKENKLNDLEKKLLSQLIELNKSNLLSPEEISKNSIYIEIIEKLELMGDYCKDILERVEIKINEKLFFSEEAVRDYNQLYEKTKETLERLHMALNENDFDLLNKVIRQEKENNELVEVLLKNHNERLIKGICSPLGCNMFINMIDFTVLIYKNAVIIAKLLKSL